MGTHTSRCVFSDPYSGNVESTLCLHPAAECEVLLCTVLRTFLEGLS